MRVAVHNLFVNQTARAALILRDAHQDNSKETRVMPITFKKG